MKNFTLLTLNLRHGHGPIRKIGEREVRLFFSRQIIKKNIERLIRFLDSLSRLPDILCLQETNAVFPFWPNVEKEIQRHLPYKYSAASYSAYIPHNNVILSQLPVNRVLSKKFNKINMPNAEWRPKDIVTTFFGNLHRGFVAAEIESIGCVINTHLYPHSAARRHFQMEEILQAVNSAWNHNNRHFVLVGDLNTSFPNDKILKLLTLFSTAPSLTEKNFTDFATWPAGYKESINIAPAQRLDYVFVSQEKRIISCERVFTGVTDHCGILATIE